MQFKNLTEQIELNLPFEANLKNAGAGEPTEIHQITKNSQRSSLSVTTTVLAHH